MTGTEVDPNSLSDDQIDDIDRLMLASPPDHRAEFAAALRAYSDGHRQMGYTPHEQTLLSIGFAAGWSTLDIGLQRVVEAVRNTEATTSRPA